MEVFLSFSVLFTDMTTLTTLLRCMSRVHTYHTTKEV